MGGNSRVPFQALCTEQQRKRNKHLSQVRCCSGQDLNKVPLEFKSKPQSKTRHPVSHFYSVQQSLHVTAEHRSPPSASAWYRDVSTGNSWDLSGGVHITGHPQDMEGRVATDILNRKVQTADKGCFPNLGGPLHLVHGLGLAGLLLTQ